jgi:hypothetical protein
MVIDVDEVVYQTDPQMAILEALYRGKAVLEGEMHVYHGKHFVLLITNVPIKA